MRICSSPPYGRGYADKVKQGGKHTDTKTQTHTREQKPEAHTDTGTQTQGHRNKDPGTDTGGHRHRGTQTQGDTDTDKGRKQTQTQTQTQGDADTDTGTGDTDTDTGERTKRAHLYTSQTSLTEDKTIIIYTSQTGPISYWRSGPIIRYHSRANNTWCKIVSERLHTSVTGAQAPSMPNLRPAETW